MLACAPRTKKSRQVLKACTRAWALLTDSGSASAAVRRRCLKPEYPPQRLRPALGLAPSGEARGPPGEAGGSARGGVRGPRRAVCSGAAFLLRWGRAF